MTKSNTKNQFETIMLQIDKIGLTDSNTKSNIDDFVNLKKLTNAINTILEKKKKALVDYYIKTGKPVLQGYQNFVTIREDNKNPVPNYHLVHSEISALTDSKWKMRVHFKKCFSNPNLKEVGNDLITGKTSYVVTSVRGKTDE